MNETEKLLLYLNDINNSFSPSKRVEKDKTWGEKKLIQSDKISYPSQLKPETPHHDSLYPIDVKTIEDSKKKLKSKSVFLF